MGQLRLRYATAVSTIVSYQVSYVLQVAVIDNGVPALSSTTRVVVTVEDVNDHAPECEQMFYKVTIPESTNLDMPLFQVRSVLLIVNTPGLIFGIQINTDSVEVTEHFSKKMQIDILKSLF